jgi:excisionase family DNA binding protein
MPEQLLPAMTVRDVAGFLAVDEKTIYRLAKQGKLPGFKVAGTWRFQLQDIQGWIDEQKSKPSSYENKNSESLTDPGL